LILTPSCKEKTRLKRVFALIGILII